MGKSRRAPRSAEEQPGPAQAETHDPPLPSLALLGLFLLVCGVLTVEAKNPMWFTHAGCDVAEYMIRAQKFFAGALEGTEYPPFAVMFFLLPRFGEVLLHIPYVEGFFYLNYALIALHLGYLNQTVGRTACLIFGALMLAAGPIALFRFELFVSALVLLAFAAWRRGWPILSGALLGAAILTKLYPLMLIPLFWRSPQGGDFRQQLVRFSLGLVGGLFGVLLFFSMIGGPVSMLGGMLSFHEHKPVGLESTPAVLAMGVDALTGRWPSHSVNTYGIHGLEFAGWSRFLITAGLLATLGALCWGVWRRREQGQEGQFVLDAQALILAVLFFSTLFQPQYLLWAVAFTALLPLSELPREHVLAFAALFLVALMAEQVIFPCHYTEFLAVFYEHIPQPGLMLSLVAGKTCVTGLFGLAVYEALRKR